MKSTGLEFAGSPDITKIFTKRGVVIDDSILLLHSYNTFLIFLFIIWIELKEKNKWLIWLA